MTGATDGTLIFDTSIDTKGVTNAKQTITKSFSGISSAARKLGVVIAAAFSVKAIVNFGKEALNVASDLQEVQNVVDTAFGSMSKQVDEWAKTTTKSFGLSELSAKKYSSTYMAMLKGSGVQESAAAKMAIKMTERLADISSFYNLTYDEVDTALTGIVTGNGVALKKLGVIMNETNLDAYALSKGLKTSYSNMDTASQIALRYQYVLEQTELAAGDFAKTSDSWANQTKLLSEQFNSLKAVIGQGLIQALTPAIKYINMLMEKIIALAKMLSAFTSKLFNKNGEENQNSGGGTAMVAAQNAMTDSVDSTTDAQDKLTDAMKKTNKEQKKSLMGFDEINRLSEETADAASSGGNTGAFDAVGGFDLGEIEFDTSSVDDILGDIEKKFNEFKKRLGSWLPKIDTSEIKKNFDETFIIAKKVWNDIKTLGSPLKNWIDGDLKEFFKSGVDYILTLFTTLQLVLLRPGTR